MKCKHTRIALLLLFATTLVAAQATGKPENAAPNAVFSSRSNLVLVPVIVQDHHGVHIPNLTKDDFKISENGAEQSVATFEEIKAETAPVRPLSKSNTTVFTNHEPEGFAPRRINIVVLDALNTEVLDQSYARRALMKFLEETATSNELTTILVLSQGGVKVVFDFTTDHAVLVKALQIIAARSGAMSGLNANLINSDPNASPLGATAVTGERNGANEDAQDVATSIQQLRDAFDAVAVRRQQEVAIQTTLDAFRVIARAYGGIPGRKSLIWVTGGFPFLVSRVGEPLGSKGFEVEFARVFNELSAANIAMYPIDARGLIANNDTVAAPPRRVSSRRGSQTQSTVLDSLRDQQMDTINTMSAFANMTGGHAFTHNNDIHRAIQRADEDSASYYVLGFYAKDAGTKQGWRKLGVKVKAPGAEVRSRAGYFFVQDTAESADQVRLRDIANALTSPFDFNSFHLTVRWTGQAADPAGKNVVKFALQMEPDSVAIDDSDHNHLSIDILAVAYDPSRKTVGQVTQQLQGHLDPAYAQKVRSTGLAYQNQFSVTPGTYMVKFVVRDNISGRLGSLNVPMNVQ